MVDHLLQVTVAAGGARGAELTGALASMGFQVRSVDGRAVASSAVAEPRSTKERLRSMGYADREYRLRLEYVRRWGFL